MRGRASGTPPGASALPVWTVVLGLMPSASLGASGGAPGGASATRPTAVAPATATEDEVPPLEAADPADTEVAEARELDRLLCRRRGCCVTKAEDAGRDGKGRTLTVVTLDASGGACLAPPLQQPEPFGSGLLDREPSPHKRRRAAARGRERGGDDDLGEVADPDGEREEAEASMEGADCRPFEFHLVVREKGKLKSRQLLSQACNDGHGTAGAGEDLIEVDPRARTFTHTQSGGSAWHGDHAITVGLDPLRVVRVVTSSYWAGDPDGSWQSSEWNWDLFSGDKTWPVADCAAAPRGTAAPKSTAKRLGSPVDKLPGQAAWPREDGGAPAEAAVAHKKVRGVLIPRVALPAGFVRDGWRTISPGACSITIDGASHGFVVQGTAGKPADASMRVVLSREDTLFVEVHDDRWVDSATSWTKGDHVQIWLGEASTIAYGQRCGAQTNGARQWGIRLSDGAVFSGAGSPAGLSSVETTRTGHVARLKIPLGVERAAGLRRLTVVYGDSDGGGKTKRLIATSELERGRSETLGDLWEVEPTQASCAEKRKTLIVTRAPLRAQPNQAVGQP